MRTSFVHWFYFGHALASRHPLFFQWVTRERQREKELFTLKIWPGTHSLLSCPRMCILGELSRIYRGRLEYLHGNVGCCKWTTSTLSTLFGLVPWQYHACCHALNLLHPLSRERTTEHLLEKENMTLNNHLKRKLFWRHGRVYVWNCEFH